MRLTSHRHKNRRSRGPRITISQDEITADLNYRGEPRRPGAIAPIRRGGR